MVALSIVGSAILLSSCDDFSRREQPPIDEGLMTEYSENMSIVESQNGRRSYHFSAPLIEGYSQAREPYREFRKGIEMTTYLDDSLSTVDIVLTANYAINYEKRELWEAKGNVVVKKSDGKELYTQQLFWNARTKKIYSNVDSKIVQNNGRDIVLVEGFESDEQFKNWRARSGKSHMEVDFTPREQTDSLSGGVPEKEASVTPKVSTPTKDSNTRKAGRRVIPKSAQAVDHSTQQATQPSKLNSRRREAKEMPDVTSLKNSNAKVEGFPDQRSRRVANQRRAESTSQNSNQQRRPMNNAATAVEFDAQRALSN